MKTVSNDQELIRVIGASKINSSNMVVEIKLWDDRIVRGSSYNGSEGADVISSEVVIVAGNLLRPHVRFLLRSRKSFIVRKGQSIVEWTISKN